MEKTEQQRREKQELFTKLWTMVNDLRGNMDGSEFKNYILGTLFYRFLSDKTERVLNAQLENDGLTYAEAWADEDYKADLIEASLEDLGYVIEPEYLFSKLVEDVNNGVFKVEQYHRAIKEIEDSTRGQKSSVAFEGLFEDLDLTSTKLGREVKDRNKLIGRVLSTAAAIEIDYEDMSIDVLGDAYEYLMSMYAQTAGKKAGEFFTPKTMSTLLSRLATLGKEQAKNIMDPTAGSGSLLLEVIHSMQKDADNTEKVGHIFAQEINSTTSNLCRMNLIMHGLSYDSFDVFNGDTLENPAFKGEKMDIIVANPPYSLNWSADTHFLEDERFSQYGKLAPKSKADFAFVQHIVSYMADDATAVVLLPHGVLFRGAAEGTIRKYLIRELNVLDAVIGLPANCFYGTGIPVACLVLRKNRANTDDILFIDASNHFESVKTMNTLRAEDIDRIVSAYEKRQDADKYAHVAKLSEIKENDYNLNIPRYVDTADEEEVISLEAVAMTIQQTQAELDQSKKELFAFMKDLQGTNTNVTKELQNCFATLLNGGDGNA